MRVKRRDRKNRVLRNGESQKPDDDMSTGTMISFTNPITFILGSWNPPTSFLPARKTIVLSIAFGVFSDLLCIGR